MGVCSKDAANAGAGSKDVETSPAKGFCPSDVTTSLTVVHKLPRTPTSIGAGAPLPREGVAGGRVRFTLKGEP